MKQRRAKKCRTETRLTLQYTLDIDRQIAEIGVELASGKEQIASMRSVATVLRGHGVTEAAADRGETQIRITRRCTEGYSEIRGDETTRISPGDVVRIGPVTAPALRL